MGMPKGKNVNHPKKGSTIKVDPIKKTKDIDTIKKLLSDNPRNHALFVLGINTNLRASDLCQITVGMVRNLKPMDEIEIKEKTQDIDTIIKFEAKLTTHSFKRALLC